MVHDMNDYNRRMISSVHVTEEGALNSNNEVTFSFYMNYVCISLCYLFAQPPSQPVSFLGG